MTEAENCEQTQLVPEGFEDAAKDVLRQIEESYNAPNVAEPEVVQRLADKMEWHGFHAYRYEILGDGSVIALWSAMPGELKIKAFSDMQEASRWSPRSEREITEGQVEA
jgi:hypothetical protein